MRRRSTLMEGKTALKKTISQKQNNSMKTVNITSEDFIFDFKAYNQEILGKYMTKKEYQTIISELNMVVTKAFITNNKKEKVKSDLRTTKKHLVQRLFPSLNDPNNEALKSGLAMLKLRFSQSLNQWSCRKRRKRPRRGKHRL